MQHGWLDSKREHGRDVINFEGFFRALGREETKLPKERKILKVTPSKIELLEFGLIDKGFAFRQVWRAKA